MANTPILLPKLFTPGYSTVEKPTISVEIEAGIKSKFNYVWSFENSIYDKDLINGLSFDPAYTEAIGIKQAGHGHCVDLSSTNTFTVLSPTYDMSSATKATVVCVFKPDVINGNNIIFATAGPAWANTITFWADNTGSLTSNTNCLSVNFGTNTASRLETASNTLSAGEWATAVISYDGSGSVCVAINGVTKTTLDGGGGIPASLGTATRFELNGNVGLNQFDGKVAFLAISEKYAATEAECREWSSNGVYGHFLKPSIQQFAMTAGAGETIVTGTGSPTAQTATSSGSGVITRVGTGSPAAETATTTATGVRTVSGSSAVQAETATTVGQGSTGLNGSGSPTAETATASGAGLRIISGSASPQAQTATANGAGLRIVSGTATTQAETATSTGAGGVGTVGTGSPTAQTATANGSGLRIVSGSSTAQAETATANGTGQAPTTGTGSPQAQAATVVGVGLRIVTGNGAVQAETATASGTDADGATTHSGRIYTAETESRVYTVETEDRVYAVA